MYGSPHFIEPDYDREPQTEREMRRQAVYDAVGARALALGLRLSESQTVEIADAAIEAISK